MDEGGWVDDAWMDEAGEMDAAVCLRDAMWGGGDADAAAPAPASTKTAHEDVVAYMLEGALLLQHTAAVTPRMEKMIAYAARADRAHALGLAQPRGARMSPMWRACCAHACLLDCIHAVVAHVVRLRDAHSAMVRRAAAPDVLYAELARARSAAEDLRGALYTACADITALATLVSASQ